jgi:hypothetical protein
VRQPEYTPGRLPPEWLKAISEAKRPSIPETHPLGPERTTRDDPLDSYDHGSELRSLIGRLKRERIRKGLSLGDISRLTQQARSAISRLENGAYTNPTLHTVYRYARALGWHIKLCAEPVRDESGSE